MAATFYKGFYLAILVTCGTSFVLGQPPQCDTQCLYDYMPVCGSDGNTYPNLCFLFVASCRNNGLAYARPGPCVIPDPCNIPCNRRYFPICGTDGVTYSNPCVLMYYQCLYVSRGIRKAYNGRCNTTNSLRPIQPATTLPPSKPACPVGCTREYLPVCGSDGVTYSNQCGLTMITCKDSSITKVRDGPCGQAILPPSMPRCPLGCNKVYEPICGSDGITYTNLCQFMRASCADPSITRVKDGPCNPPPVNVVTTLRPSVPPTLIPTTTIRPDREFCRKDCPLFLYDPLCGTDGVTYTNKCTFDVAVCVNSTLKKDYNGDCV